jgi:hypothetical protein
MNSLLQLLLNGGIAAFAELRMLRSDEIRASPADERRRSTAGHKNASERHGLK